MQDYLLYSLISLFLSMIFSMGGAGSGIALIPILHFLGFDFTVAKEVGLFAGATTTITSSIMNLKRKVVDFKFMIPIALMMLVFAPIGAYSSQF
ncbi:MAG TPA: sulfite exporter TauE/SafE family protein, partial [Campylobacterales bacterium]|nr:sulfite exporter TauE/SafE family protein [Campylobacterales bacterium]